MYKINLNNALVRIIVDDCAPKQPVGAGFLVAPHHIITCTHVIADALNIRRDTVEPPESTVFLDFPLLDRQPMVRAKAVKWYPVREGTVIGELEDIAVLELISDSPLPDGAKPVPVVMTDPNAFFDRPVRMCGFPRGMDNGDWVSGKLQGMTGNGWVQFDRELGQRSVAPGFSGTAVWDKGENAVAGMVVSIISRDGESSAYMIPAAALNKAWPELDQHSRPPNPFRGLEAFREQDAPYYFGRDAVIKDLQKAIQKESFVAVIGASGSGKSSLVFAGLVPCLRETDEWVIADFRPKNQPFYRLALALIPLLYNDKLKQAEKLTEFSSKLDAGKIGLSEIVQLITQEHEDRRLLLIADQFEELYTLNPDKDLQHRFADTLFQCISSPDFSLMLTMRADFMGQAIAYGPFAKALNNCPTEILAPMSEGELRDAIERPAEKSGIKLEPGLTDLILKGLGREPGNLPLLEFALTQLWEKQTYRQLTHDAYKEIGGVNKALACHADAVYAEFSLKEQYCVRRFFVQLVRPGEGTEDTRQVANREQVKPENWGLVARLADKRLVVTGRDEKTELETVEVVHEALIHNWKPLRKWMEEEREFRTWQERLRAGIRQWESSKYDKEALLRGATLTEAERWMEKKRDSISSEEQDFIENSLQVRRRFQRRKAIGVSVIIALTIVVAVIFSFLWKNAETLRREAEKQTIEVVKQKNKVEDQKRIAEKQRKVAFSRQLAAQAISQLDEHLDLSLLLSIEACKSSETIEARKSLHASLKYKPYLMCFLHGHKNSVKSLTFSPNGNILASSAEDKTIILWNIKKQQLIEVPLKEHTDFVLTVAFSYDGRKFASGSADKTIILWDIEKLQPIGEPLKGHTDSVLALAFSPDGRTLVSASKDNTINLWDIDNGKQTEQFFINGKVLSVAFSPDGKILASGTEENLMLWDIEKRQSIGALRSGYEGAVHTVAFNPNGRILAFGSNNNIFLCNLEKRLPIGKLSVGLKGKVHSLAFTSDGKILASGSGDNIILWDVKKQKPIRKILTEHKELVSNLAFSPDGKILASGGDNTILLWNIEKPILIRQFLSQHEGYVYSVTFSPNGKKLASGSWDGTIILWDIEKQQLMGKLFNYPKYLVNSVAFSPNSKMLASNSIGNSVVLWDIEKKQPIGQSFIRHNDLVSSIAFSSDGKILASGSEDRTVMLWDIEKRQQIGQPFIGHNDSVSSIAFSSDGKILASGSEDKTVMLWDIEKRQQIGQPFIGHKGSVLTVAFNPVDRVLASGSEDNDIILWDIEKQQPIGLFRKHKDSVQSIAFSPDGKLLASGSKDYTIILWNVSYKSWQTTACSISNRNLTREEWVRYFEGEPYRKTCADFPIHHSLLD
ncbi:MAG: hypothetical protein GY795_46320 [Desulfobacterales bacterium]|nr:hypothetical protein [Desulfobacterales bacterium]